MSARKNLNPVEERFLSAIKHHMDGWKRKIQNDFRKESYEAELAALAGDPVYQKFAFDCPEYVMVRLMGRMSISVGRRLGEIYDKIPRFVASACFDVRPEQVAEKFKGLELDIALRFKSVSQEDRELACTRFRRHRVRCFHGTGGASWRGGSSHGSSSLRRCG